MAKSGSTVVNMENPSKQAANEERWSPLQYISQHYFQIWPTWIHVPTWLQDLAPRLHVWVEHVVSNVRSDESDKSSAQ